MAQTTTSAPQQGVPMPAVDLRQLLGAVVSGEGVRTGADLAVTQRGAGANMSVDVAAGTCLIQDDHASGGGFYGYTLGATANVAIGTANATNPRIDRVVVKILDNALGDASNSASVTVVAGTATSGATLANLTGAASVPNSSLLLANVLVPAASSSVTNGNIDTTGASNNSPAVRPMLTRGGASQSVYATQTAQWGASTLPASFGTLLQTMPTATYEASLYFLEVNLHNVRSNTAGSSLFFQMAEGGSGITNAGPVQIDLPQTAANGADIFIRIPFTPTAGSHTYQVYFWANSATPTFTLVATADRPLIFRIAKA